MAKRVGKRGAACCEPACSNGSVQGVSCCKVDALVTIDGRLCCLSLIKADAFGASIKGLLGPMVEEMLQG